MNFIMHIFASILSITRHKTIFYLTFLLVIAFLFFQIGKANALCIKDKKANLRLGPGKHYEKLWTVFKYMPLRQLGEKGNWLKVQDLEGDIYWVYKKITTKSYMCAVIKNDKTKLRQGPSTKFPEVKWSPQAKFFSMKVLKIKKSWVHIEDSAGDQAWVHRPLLWIQ